MKAFKKQFLCLLKFAHAIKLEGFIIVYNYIKNMFCENVDYFLIDLYHKIIILIKVCIHFNLVFQMCFQMAIYVDMHDLSVQPGVNPSSTRCGPKQQKPT